MWIYKYSDYFTYLWHIRICIIFLNLHLSFLRIRRQFTNNDSASNIYFNYFVKFKYDIYWNICSWVETYLEFLLQLYACLSVIPPKAFEFSWILLTYDKYLKKIRNLVSCFATFFFPFTWLRSLFIFWDHALGIRIMDSSFKCKYLYKNMFLPWNFIGAFLPLTFTGQFILYDSASVIWIFEYFVNFIVI